jgi:A/G-specific adenine glycosylase
MPPTHLEPAVVTPARVRRLRRALLAWATTDGRSFFWRDDEVSPFQVVVVEILLAKTQAAVAAPVARTLLARYPDAAALGRARARDLQRLLYPLGLQRKRAHHLRECARALVDRHGGNVPSSVDELMELPFVGRYAANAIACVAFTAPVAVVDANVARIYQRAFSLPQPPARLSIAHGLWEFANMVVPPARAKEFNWALLDLGGTICTAKAPACERCPLARICDRALAAVTPIKSPKRAAKTEKDRRHRAPRLPVRPT